MIYHLQSKDGDRTWGTAHSTLSKAKAAATPGDGRLIQLSTSRPTDPRTPGEAHRAGPQTLKLKAGSPTSGWFFMVLFLNHREIFSGNNFSVVTKHFYTSAQFRFSFFFLFCSKLKKTETGDGSIYVKFSLYSDFCPLVHL